MRANLRASLGLTLIVPLVLSLSAPSAQADAITDMRSPVYQVSSPSTWTVPALVEGGAYSAGS